MKEEAEGVPRRVKEHPEIVLRLVYGACGTRCDRIRLGLGQVIDAYIEMQHLLLLLGKFRPHRGLISRLGLEREPRSPSGHLSSTQSGSLSFTSQPSSRP